MGDIYDASMAASKEYGVDLAGALACCFLLPLLPLLLKHTTVLRCRPPLLASSAEP